MCENLTYELVSRGHDVLVVSLFDYQSAITNRLIENGVRLMFLNKKPGIDFPIISRIRKVIKEEKPDIVHTHRYILKYIFFASVGLDVKIVHTVHNIAQKENNALDRFINGWLFKMKKALPVALSKLVKSTILETYKLEDSEVPIVLNGERLHALNKRKDYSVGENIKIIHVGRYTEVKNHANLISAVVNLHKMFPNVQLHLYGNGRLKASINEQIKKMNAYEYIFDKGLTDNVASALADADIFVLPSYFEGVPMTIIEAMDSALPIVASNVGGIPDMIEDGVDGLLCGTDADSICNCLSSLVRNRNLRIRIGQAAKQKAEQFSAAAMARSYEQIYKKLLASE
jgi:glycosyltransferase involved in cell wall biosynthesis